MKIPSRFFTKFILLSMYLVGGSAFFILLITKGIMTLTDPLYLLGIYLFICGWVWLARTYLSKQKTEKQQPPQHEVIH
ncbi:MAG TPA: hypothetical protein VEY51_06465 [Chondromyces sp.]|nr:hypothetical protein [Chondromyces sp.]